MIIVAFIVITFIVTVFSMIAWSGSGFSPTLDFNPPPSMSKEESLRQLYMSQETGVKHPVKIPRPELYHTCDYIISEREFNEGMKDVSRKSTHHGTYRHRARDCHRPRFSQEGEEEVSDYTAPKVLKLEASYFDEISSMTREKWNAMVMGKWRTSDSTHRSSDRNIQSSNRENLNVSR